MSLRADTSSFFELPVFKGENASAVLFGIASSLGCPTSGAENGPFFIRRLSKYYTSRFGGEADIFDIRQPHIGLGGFYDAGDLVANSDLVELAADVEAFIFSLPEGTVPIAVGGDHSVTLPLVRGITRRTPISKVVIFDHHLDTHCWGEKLDTLYHTNVSSHVARLMGPSRIVHIGIEPVQGVEKGWRERLVSDLAEMGTQLPLGEVQGYGEDELIRAVGRSEQIYISIDVDVLQDVDMSATGYPSWNGLSLAALISMVEFIAKHNQIVGCDIVEFAADRSARDKRTLSDAGRAAVLLMHVVMAVARQSDSVRN